MREVYLKESAQIRADAGEAATLAREARSGLSSQGSTMRDELLKLLMERGAQVDYCDPHFPETRIGRRQHLQLESIALSPEAFAGYDVVLVSTAHKEFRDPELYHHVELVVDTRNVVEADPLRGPKTVVRA